MVYQPPLGARDLLPVEVAQQQWIESRLRAVFERWGYQRIVTSTLERLDTLMAGGAVQRQSLLQVLSKEEGELGLRPELTASIARAAVTRLAKAPRPLRLFYLANVFRRQQEQERYQAGVELLGAGSVLADAEALLLLSDCLSALGLAAPDGQSPCTIILGQAALTKSLLSPFPEALRGKVLAAIAHLNRLTLETLDFSPALRQLALGLMDLRGEPAEVLRRLNQFDLNGEQRAIAQRLGQLTELLAARLAMGDRRLSWISAWCKPSITTRALFLTWPVARAAPTKSWPREVAMTNCWGFIIPSRKPHPVLALALRLSPCSRRCNSPANCPSPPRRWIGWWCPKPRPIKGRLWIRQSSCAARPNGWSCTWRRAAMPRR
jgi:hypothetical protein